MLTRPPSGNAPRPAQLGRLPSAAAATPLQQAPTQHTSPPGTRQQRPKFPQGLWAEDPQAIEMPTSQTSTSMRPTQTCWPTSKPRAGRSRPAEEEEGGRQPVVAVRVQWGCPGRGHRPNCVFEGGCSHSPPPTRPLRPATATSHQSLPLQLRRREQARPRSPQRQALLGLRFRQLAGGTVLAACTTRSSEARGAADCSRLRTSRRGRERGAKK
mmetsp:Transcript_60024/g.159564  ORF Transcript_60024/g.159564 Transcript_60024/m.159564 type:complete len:213 (-) Transcript_60024:1259-1897(-)